MVKVTQTSSRKSDHIRINLEEDVNSSLTTGLEGYNFIHEALPDINLEDVNLCVEVFRKRLEAPILISSMTGGTKEATKINLNLAAAAQKTGIAMGIGSQRAAIEDPELIESFQVRKVAPDILLFANLGAIQLNYGYSLGECQRAVEMIEADALILHLNPLQEAVQPEGNTRFAKLLEKIEEICKNLPVPVIAKEVGWGFSGQTAKKLSAAGVTAIDIAGAGGTSWTQVEMHRAKTEDRAKLASAFFDWGIPTAESIAQVKEAAPELIIFGSGGLRTGIDIAKCIALGASLGGIASPLLKAANNSAEMTIQKIQEISNEIRVCMFAAGIEDHEQLQKAPLVKRNNQI
jgi:isopentenyl-diphosphate delta-isomerase